MRRRKDVASLIRNIERSSERNTSMGIASSIAKDGSIINGQNYSDGETRDLSFALPYGISSSGLDGIRIQIITNDNRNNVAVGVIDKKKPPVKPGCITIYDKSGSSISLNGDGSITINAERIEVKTNDTKFSGTVSFGDMMSVDDGNIKFHGNVDFSGGMSIDSSGNVNVKKDITMDGGVNMNGDVTMTQEVSMDGGVNITGSGTLNGRQIETI